MSKPLRKTVSFAILDRENGLPELPEPTGEEFPLPAWYRSVYSTPLDELGVEDICKACRQQIHLEHTVPLAFDLLKKDPLAGEMYDGEVLVSLRAVPSVYWSEHQNERLFLRLVVEAVLSGEEIADNVRQDLTDLLHKLQ